ncbi:MAG: 30S ribosomal protein S20 [Treponema sp.]|nr:30S ribosomal protein S20 [Treponema sp.]MBQ2552240.1 30S ribosomal protein S20 [Treponema sp.]MBQ4235763.1 30S ribosomal protein S20 [Treponema sp.]MBQ5385175.1 30S ribosomal protein S20 [Treponema sp.]
MADEKKVAVKKSSAEKRHAQSEVRRLRNKAVKSTCRTSAKKFVAAVQKKDQEEAKKALVALQSEYDTAVRKGVIHRNAASRKKSRMYKLYNVTFNASAAEAK